MMVSCQTAFYDPLFLRNGISFGFSADSGAAHADHQFIPGFSKLSGQCGCPSHPGEFCAAFERASRITYRYSIPPVGGQLFAIPDSGDLGPRDSDAKSAQNMPLVIGEQMENRFALVPPYSRATTAALLHSSIAWVCADDLKQEIQRRHCLPRQIAATPFHCVRSAG